MLHQILTTKHLNKFISKKQAPSKYIEQPQPSLTLLAVLFQSFAPFYTVLICLILQISSIYHPTPESSTCQKIDKKENKKKKKTESWSLEIVARKWRRKKRQKTQIQFWSLDLKIFFIGNRVAKKNHIWLWLLSSFSIAISISKFQTL